MKITDLLQDYEETMVQLPTVSEVSTQRVKTLVHGKLPRRRRGRTILLLAAVVVVLSITALTTIADEDTCPWAGKQSGYSNMTTEKVSGAAQGSLPATEKVVPPVEISEFIEKVNDLYEITVPEREILSISTEGALWGGEEKMLRYKKDHITITGFWNEDESLLYQIMMTDSKITDFAASGPVSGDQLDLDLAVLEQNTEDFILKWDGKITIKEIEFCSRGTVNEQLAVWMWVQTENGNGYYVILGEGNQKPIGIKQLPDGINPNKERGGSKKGGENP